MAAGTVPGIVKEPTIEDLYIWAEMGILTAAQLEMINYITRAGLRTKTQTRKAKRLRLKRKRKLKRKRPRRNKNQHKLPSEIKSIKVDVNNVSKWIAEVSFTFPTIKPIRSDDRGTLRFILKKGTVIRFVRVKRGTFSVISLVFGTGYRVWSQF
jgi:hypothetical protein